MSVLLCSLTKIFFSKASFKIDWIDDLDPIDLGIFANIPKSIGSRSSIQSILNEALEKNIFVKEQSKTDKRIKNYYLSNNFLDMINTWLRKEGSFFSKMSLEN